MKKYIFLILIVFGVQSFQAQNKMNNSYNDQWKKVEQAFQKGLNKTAQTEIEKILGQAKKENNTEQYIKALCNLRVSMRDRDEISRLNDILFFEKEIKGAAFPAKQLLHSMLADLYWTYYIENRWKILDRTKVEYQHEQVSNSNIDTWSADDFYHAAYTHYMISIDEPQKSLHYPIKNISEILGKEKNTEKLRPTLYDFLVHRAIDYFQQGENELTKPAYTFEINDEKAFAPANTFAKARFKTSDTISQKYNCLKLYQEVLMFHLNDADPSALIDADIARIQFVHNKSISTNKDELYVKALNNIANTYPNNEQAAMASALIAETYTQGGQHIGRRGYYNSSIDESKINYVEAKKLCDAIVEKFPNSEASAKAEGILQQIEMRNLHINTEKIVLPNVPSLAMITFKNVKTLYCKVVKLSVKEVKERSLDNNNDYQVVVKREGIINWKVQLPKADDYKSHTTEIKIEPLPLGVYAIVVSEDENFDKEKYYALTVMNVSNLSYITGTQNDKSGTEVYVVHRETGEPLKDINVNTWSYQYDYNSRKYITRQGSSYITDQFGNFKMTKLNPSSGGWFLELIKGDDDLYLQDNIYINQYYPRPTTDYPRAFLFTDRSMYRPGQKIYFKGIMIMTHGNDSKKYEILADRKTQVTLKDANYQDVKTLDVTTNEFGSFTGEFIAPDGLLTGQFQIVCESGQTFFNIEEYKRPKFEVMYDTIKGTYKLNDEIRIKGLAKAFAGNNIDGATVKYRVVRNVRFPYYWCFYRWGQPSSPEMEIAHGTAKTNADGSFDISFKAIPDASIDKQTMPVFDYEIIADVTDLNGETRSGTTHMSVSYQSLLVKIDAEEQININNFNAVKVFTTNLSGTHIPSQVTLTLKKLVTPAQTYRTRLWPSVDMPLYSEKEFHKLFPLDEYQQENNHLNWEEEKTVWTKTFTSTKEGLEYLQKTGSGNGWYVLEAKVDEVVDKKYIRLKSKSVEGIETALPNEHLLVTKAKDKAEPGEKYRINFATPYSKIHVLCNYLRQTNMVQLDGKNRGVASSNATEWVTWNQHHYFEFDITEANRGGFYTNGWYVKNNRYYSFNEFIEVPYTNKELSISLETFRDKMLPGSEQEWKLKITGSKKELVSAELLATMYDASLDAFKPHSFQAFGLYASNANLGLMYWNPHSNFQKEHGRQFYFGKYKAISNFQKVYRSLNWYGLNTYGVYYRRKGGRSIELGGVRSSNTHYLVDGLAVSEDAPPPPAAPQRKEMEKSAASEIAGDMHSVKGNSMDKNFSKQTDSTSHISHLTSHISLRSNFSETAFFFPQLQTDAAGNIILKFKAPDALTRWKLMAFAHTKNIESASFTSTATTQKELMIVPNTPRFMREGDKMVYSAKVTNLRHLDINGHAYLQLYDATTDELINDLFKNTNYIIPFTIKKGESTSITWEIEVPHNYYNPIKVVTTAMSPTNDKGAFRDGEQNVVPVIPNSMLVTETLPLPVKPNTTKNFKFENLINSKNSNTLRHYNLSVEYTGNPAWYAIQSLPYLTNYPYECAEQTFNRYYANVLASHIANSNPKIKEIFSTWKEKDTMALMSNLQKNQELKSALLQETPWVLEAKTESEQKKNIALLFDLNRMSKELERCVRELEIMQTSNGGFTWFKGMPDDRFITQYILTGIGRLQHINVSEVGSERRIQNIVIKAIPYLDARLKEDYDNLKKYKADLSKQQIGSFQVQYLYMRSFFKHIPVNDNCKTAFNFYLKQAGQYWLHNGKYIQAMSALALDRWNDKTNAQAIIKSLRENAIHNEEMGMYYKDLVSSYWWYQAPIEAQALLIEAFKEVAMDQDAVDELKIWLLKNKQTTNWKTTKATADACYALLLNGTYWLAATPTTEIRIGDKIINSNEQKQEAGTGYFKTYIPQEEIKADMGTISVQVKSDKSVGTTWGAVYWQYFEDLDKIPSAETGLKLKKQLYKISNSDKGEVLTAITENSPLHVGDKVKVRIELRVDRPMEYVHMKDMRGACFEPINVLSNYKYQGGLGYYEATKDLATNFFFHYLQKGTYVFEYPMFVTNKGDYSNGIATIQCMYAPEFSSHSEGVRVKVK